jgi:hypothetical protein
VLLRLFPGHNNDFTAFFREFVHHQTISSSRLSAKRKRESLLKKYYPGTDPVSRKKNWQKTLMEAIVGKLLMKIF